MYRGWGSGTILHVDVLDVFWGFLGSGTTGVQSRGEGLVWEDVEFLVEGVKILIRTSKTDKRAAGREVLLSSYPLRIFCPVHWGMRVFAGRTTGTGMIFKHMDDSKVMALQLLAVLRKA